MDEGWLDGRIQFADAPTVAPPLLAPGIHWPLGEELTKPALFVPMRAKADSPLLVFFHGARSHPLAALPLVRAEAERRGAIVFLPRAQNITWDLMAGGLGVDVAALQISMNVVQQTCAFDRSRIAIGGFSDGASYAVTLGVRNGDIFSRVMAFSPGFVIRGEPIGTPSIFLSHGNSDRLLPIEHCSLRIAAALEEDGYAVELARFDGGHEVEPKLVTRAFDGWNTLAPAR